MRVALLALLFAPLLWAQEDLAVIETVRIEKVDPQAEHRPVYSAIYRARAEQDKRVRPSTSMRDFRPARGTALWLRHEAIAAAIASGQDAGAAFDEYYRRVQALLVRREKYSKRYFDDPLKGHSK